MLFTYIILLFQLGINLTLKININVSKVRIKQRSFKYIIYRYKYFDLYKIIFTSRFYRDFSQRNIQTRYAILLRLQKFIYYDYFRP